MISHEPSRLVALSDRPAVNRRCSSPLADIARVVVFLDFAAVPVSLFHISRCSIHDRQDLRTNRDSPRTRHQLLVTRCPKIHFRIPAVALSIAPLVNNAAMQPTMAMPISAPKMYSTVVTPR